MPLFQILKEYGVENEPLASKYRTNCVKWYRNRHVAMMDGLPFTTEKPPKNFNEAVEQAKQTASKKAQEVSVHLNVFGS